MKVLNLTLSIPGNRKVMGRAALNYVGLFSGKFFRVPGFFSGGEGSVSTPPKPKG